MDREVKRLKRSRIPLVKVRWNSRRGPEFTWEREDQFRKKYPHLFTKTALAFEHQQGQNAVMSDSDESTVTYTEVSSPFEGLSDIGSPGVVGPEHEGLPWMLDDPPEPVYPEYMPQEDEVFPAEEQPLPAAASPTAQSLDYVQESDPEEDPEEDDDEDPKEDPADYPADGGDDGDDKDELSDDDEDDGVDIEADESEGRGCQTSRYIYSTIITTFPMVITTSLDTFSTTTLDTITLTSVGLSSCDDPAESQGRIYFPFTTITTTHHTLHTRPDAPSPGISPLHLLSINRREDRPEVTLPPRKRLGIALGPRYEVRESSSAAAAARLVRGLRADYGFVATIDREIKRDLERDVGYGITDSWDEIVEAMQGTTSVRCGRVYQRMIEFRLGLARHRTRFIREVMSLRTTVLAQQSEIRELQSVDRRRQTVITEMLAADHKRSSVNAYNANKLRPVLGRVRDILVLSVETQGHFKRECTKLNEPTTIVANQGGMANAQRRCMRKRRFYRILMLLIKGLGVVLMQGDKPDIHSMEVDNITMDFVTKLPKKTDPMDKLARIYQRRLSRDGITFFQSFMIMALGAQSERTIQTLKDMLRGCAIDFGKAITLIEKDSHMFHVIQLKCAYADEPLAVPLDGLHFDDKLQFVEEPVEIMDREVKRLKRSSYPLFKSLEL
ncbi:hypothetical protein Tco_1407574 [Tanacetum coccineum]